MDAPTENVCKTIFQIYSSQQSSCIDLKHVLSICEVNQLFSSMTAEVEKKINHPPHPPVYQSSGSIQEVISHVHSCLGSSKCRAEGLLLLAVLVRQCSTSVFQQNALTWMKLLIQTLQSHCPTPVYSASCQVLAQIIQFSKTFSDLTREITTSMIPQLLPLLIAAPAEVNRGAMSCINQCIRTYPGPVGPFKNKVETLILQELDDGTCAKTVFQCFALLTQCGPGGAAGIKYTEAWTQQYEKLSGSLSSTAGALYEGLESECLMPNEGRQCLSLSAIELDQTDRVTALVSRWKTLIGCMMSLLSEEMLAPVKVPADQILQLVYRCLSVNTTMVLQRPTSERTLLGAFIPEIHIGALDMLEQIIILCRRNLVPHCRSIVGVLCQQLAWTQIVNLGYNKQYGVLRQRVYVLLATWLKALDGTSGILTEETTLVKHILLDCAPFSDTLQLSAEGGSSAKFTETSSKKGKKKRKGYQEINEGISSQRKVHQQANSELVAAALDALYWLLTTTGSEMSGKKAQDVQGFIIHTLFLVQQSVDSPVPYSSISCRKGLYRVLQACVLSPHPKAPPPTQLALQIFSTGTLDQCLEVSSLCIEASRLCEALIHPRAPCLNGPVICDRLVDVGKTLLEPVPVIATESDTFSNEVMQTTGHELNGMQDIPNEKLAESMNIDRDTSLDGDNDSKQLKRKRHDSDKEVVGNKQMKVDRTVIEVFDDSESENDNEERNSNGTEVVGNKQLKDEKNVVEIEHYSESDGNKIEKNGKITEVNIEGNSAGDKLMVHGDNGSMVVDKQLNDQMEEKKRKEISNVDTENQEIKAGTNRTNTENATADVRAERKVGDVSSNDDDDASPVGDVDTANNADNKEADPEFAGMVSAFIDAGPDSD